MEPWRMDGNKMELWSLSVELVIDPLALVTCGDLEINNIAVKRTHHKILDACTATTLVVLIFPAIQ